MRVRTKRHICAYVAMAGFLFTYGSVGYVELGGDFTRGVTQAVIGLVIGVAAIYKSGYWK